MWCCRRTVDKTRFDLIKINKHVSDHDHRVRDQNESQCVE